MAGPVFGGSVTTLGWLFVLTCFVLAARLLALADEIDERNGG